MNKHAKTALVTGASSGIGRGIALGLADAGWNVGINYHSNRNGAEETAEQVQAFGRKSWILQADVGDGEQVRTMFSDLQMKTDPLGLLVNNAGVQTWAPLLDLAEEDWDRTIRTNLKGTFLCTQQAARRMKASGGGRIVNIGSGANKSPFPNLADYCASKGGIEMLTRVSAVELGPHGITVNCVAPGSTEIERTKQEDPDYAKAWAPLTPMRRIGTVEDVVRAVVFLTQDTSDFITGQTLYVDGGLYSQVPWAY